MQHGRNNGKKLMAVRIIAHAFEIVSLTNSQTPDISQQTPEAMTPPMPETGHNLRQAS